MILVQADQIPGVWTSPPHRRELKVLLSPWLQDVSADLAIGMVTIPPGGSGDPHHHEKEQETWYVLSGRARLRLGVEEVELSPDTIVVAPPGVQHQIMNSGDEPLRALFIYTPAGPERGYLGGERAMTLGDTKDA